MKKSSNSGIAVLGGGHAGRGLAGFLALHGFDVSLYNRTSENVRAINERGGLDVHGVIEGFAPLTLVTDNMAQAILERDILIVTVPAQAHRFFAHKMAPHLGNNQLVLLMPGRTGGILEFANQIGLQCNIDKVMLGEAQTFSFVSRITGKSSVLISKIKNQVQVSAFPAKDNHEFLYRLDELPVSLVTASNVMETGLNNIGAMLHPTPTILCAGLLESRPGGYNHYHEAISESVGRLIEKMDAERVSILKEFSIPPMFLLDWLKDVYDAKGHSLCECIKSIDAYDEVGSPSTLQHRYVLEEIPTGLVPISRLASLCGLDTPAIDSVINIACQLYNHDFWYEGRSLTDMGIADMIPSEVLDFVESGNRPLGYSSRKAYWDIYSLRVDEI